MHDPKFFPYPELTTGRLLLRRLEIADAPVIMFLRSDDTVMRYIDREKVKSLEEAAGFIDRINISLNNNDGIMWGICLKEDPGTLIGTIGFWRLIKQHYRAELGYMLHPDHWNKGIMKEAILAVTGYAFGPMQLHSIEAHINPANTASGIVLERSGFVREAYFKEDFYFRGTFTDTAVYSLLTPH